MKKSLLSLIVCLFLVGTSAYASFPVNNQSNTEKTEQATSTDEVTATQASADLETQANEEVAASEDDAPMSDKEMWITLALLVFLGGFAAHRWYRGKPAGWNILFILTAGGCGIWAIVDLVNILRGDF